MSLSTKIDGDPAGIRAVGQWLNDALGNSVRDVADTMHTAHGKISEVWGGAAGDAAKSKLSRGAKEIDTYHAVVTDAVRKVADLAGGLDAAQQRMAGVRDQARSGGLTVTGTRILPPPPLPTPPMWEATDRAADAMADAIRDRNAQLAVYEDCRNGVAAARAIWDNARDAFGNAVGSVKDDPFGTALKVVGASGATKSHWFDQAKRQEEIADLLDKTPTDSEFVREALDETRKGYLDEASRNRLLGELAKAADKVGIAGDLASAAYDLHNGEDPEKVVAELVGGQIGTAIGAAIGGGLLGPPGAAAGAFIGGLAGEEFGPEIWEGLKDTAEDTKQSFLGWAYFSTRY